MFLKPSTLLLATNAERVPCADQLPLRFESRDLNSWIVADSNGIRNEKKPELFYKMFEHQNTFNFTHTKIDFSENGGIYTKEQLQKTKDYINHRDTKIALSSAKYFDQTGGKPLSHSEIKGQGAWSLLTLAQALGGIDLKRIIDTAVSWIKGLAHTYMAG